MFFGGCQDFYDFARLKTKIEKFRLPESESKIEFTRVVRSTGRKTGEFTSQRREVEFLPSNVRNACTSKWPSIGFFLPSRKRRKDEDARKGGEVIKSFTFRH